MKIIDTNVAEALIFKVDYRTIPELLEFSKENSEYEDFLNRNLLEYNCIRDVGYPDAVHHYVFFGFEGHGILYPLGLYACGTEDCFRYNIENNVIKPSDKIIQNIIDEVVQCIENENVARKILEKTIANHSTLACYNCDHKDEYIEELEAELSKLKEQEKNDEKLFSYCPVDFFTPKEDEHFILEWSKIICNVTNDSENVATNPFEQKTDELYIAFLIAYVFENNTKSDYTTLCDAARRFSYMDFNKIKELIGNVRPNSFSLKYYELVTKAIENKKLIEHMQRRCLKRVIEYPVLKYKNYY